MTVARKNQIFLFSGVLMLQVISFFLIALVAQRLYSALSLLDVVDEGFIFISTGGLVIGFIIVVMLAVLVYEMRKDGFSLNVDLNK